MNIVFRLVADRHQHVPGLLDMEDQLFTHAMNLPNSIRAGKSPASGVANDPRPTTSDSLLRRLQNSRRWQRNGGKRMDFLQNNSFATIPLPQSFRLLKSPLLITDCRLLSTIHFSL